MWSPLRSWNFVEFLAFFLPALVVSYLQIRQTKNKLHYKSLPMPFCCGIQSFKAIGLWGRLLGFETKTRREPLRPILAKMGLETRLQTEIKPRDSITDSLVLSLAMILSRLRNFLNWACLTKVKYAAEL